MEVLEVHGGPAGGPGGPAEVQQRSCWRSWRSRGPEVQRSNGGPMEVLLEVMEVLQQHAPAAGSKAHHPC